MKPSGRYSYTQIDSEPPDSLKAHTARQAVAAWVKHTSKSVAILLAVWGTISTMAGAAMAYWSMTQGWVKDDRMAKVENLLREMNTKLDLASNNTSSQGARLATLENWDRIQDDRIAGKKDKSR